MSGGTVDLLDLASTHECFFTTSDVALLERANKVHSLLTATQVLPHLRKTLYGGSHSLFAALLVVVADHYEGRFHLSTRDSTALAKEVLGSSVTKWLQAAVKQNLLIHDQKTGVYQITTTLKIAAKPLSDIEVINA